MVDIFSGVLAGSGFGELVYGANNPAESRVGHFFAAICIDAFRDITVFTEDMDQLIEMLKNSPKAAGEDRIYIHGEKEFERAERAAVEGVRLSDVTVKTLIEAGEQAGVPFDLIPLKVD